MLAPGYSLRRGKASDRLLLVRFMQRTYEELYPGGSFAHLAQTVDQCFSSDTPLWWVDDVSNGTSDNISGDASTHSSASPSTTHPSEPASPTPVGCLWLGSAIDQIAGERYTYIFLLYVSPAHRRRRIGTALMQVAETWTQAKGDRQIGLQVFQANQPARHLYEKLGFQPQSLLMVKPLLPTDR